MTPDRKLEIRISKRDAFKGLLMGAVLPIGQGIDSALRGVQETSSQVLNNFTRGSKRFESSVPTVRGATGYMGATRIDFGVMFPSIIKGASSPWEAGKFQTFSEIELPDGNHAFQNVDIGTLGPDVDVIWAFDFRGDIPTGALTVHAPNGPTVETRVIGIKRTDLTYVQFRRVLRGDAFHVRKISDYGGDPALDADARAHASNSAHEHQKVVYIGDLGLFQRQYGSQEMTLLRTMIRAQHPPREDLGIGIPNFVSPPTVK